MNNKLLLLPLAALCLASCQSANREAEVKAIAALEETAFQGWPARSASQVAAIYAPDARIQFANLPPMKGADMEGLVKEMFADPNLSAKFANSRIEVSNSGDLGYVEGTYEFITTDRKTSQPVREKGRYLTVFAKQPGGPWKAISDMSTPDGPPTPAQLQPGK